LKAHPDDILNFYVVPKNDLLVFINIYNSRKSGKIKAKKIEKRAKPDLILSFKRFLR
jgi:hypothetical protein